MPREYFLKYFLQNEETGADELPPSAGTPAPQDDKAKTLISKLRKEADDATKRAKAAEDRLTAIEQDKELEAAKKAGDFEALKERLALDVSTARESAKKEKDEAVSLLASKDAKFKSQLKRKEIKAAFALVFKPEFIEDFVNNSAYAKQLEVVETEDGDYEVIVVESNSDRTQKYKVDGKKTVPFTIEDWANEIASKKPSAAKPTNRASGDNIPNGNGQNRGSSNFNMNASPQDLVAKSLGF